MPEDDRAAGVPEIDDAAQGPMRLPLMAFFGDSPCALPIMAATDQERI
jgi:hypothetical protein